MSTATLVPIVKNKEGNLCDADNNHAIAISTAISKLFEFVLLQRMTICFNGSMSDQ